MVFFCQLRHAYRSFSHGCLKIQAAFAGDYALMPGFVLTVRARDGKLHAQATGQGEFPLDAAGADTFEAAAYGIEIVFKRDQAGAVASLDLHQGGQVLSGKRN